MALAWGMRGWEVEIDEPLSTGEAGSGQASGKRTLSRSLSDSAIAGAAARTPIGLECEAASTAEGTSSTVDDNTYSPYTAASSSPSGTASSGSSQLGDEHQNDAASERSEDQKMRRRAVSELELPPTTLDIQDSPTAQGSSPSSGFGQDVATPWVPQGAMIIYVPVQMSPDSAGYGAAPMGYGQVQQTYEEPQQYTNLASAPSPSPAVDSWSPERSAMEMDIAAAQLQAAARRAEAAKKSRAQRPADKKAKKASPQPQQPQQKQPQPCQAGKVATGSSGCKFQDRTSIMLRNLPNDYTLTMLLALLDAEGFKARYDFAYLPVDFTRWAGFGYAFVNMVSHQDALAAWRHFQGFENWQVSSQKVCEVCWGDPLQGLTAHIERYRNSPVMHEGVPDGCKPAVFSAGVRIPFPLPTKRIRAPRAKQPGHGRVPERVAESANHLQMAAVPDASGPCAAGNSKESAAARSLREAWEIALARKV